MSDKTFLQELQSIKSKVEQLAITYEKGETSLHYVETITNEIKQDLQAMINQCIEIQIAMTKQENAKKFYNTKDF